MLSYSFYDFGKLQKVLISPSLYFMYILKYRHDCVCEKYTKKDHVKRQIQYEAKLSAVFVSRHLLSVVFFNTK